jgi:predicted GNAT family acetyltransferase
MDVDLRVRDDCPKANKWPSLAMTSLVHFTNDPGRVLADGSGLLESDPVAHNVVLTLLHRRVEAPEPGRYWIVETDGEPAGVVFQSPLSFAATLTPMPMGAVAAVVDTIVEQHVALPGVNGDAATAARFAGHWTERTKSAARPVQGQRVYEVERVIPARPAGGELRRAVASDRDPLVAMFNAFSAESGEGLPPQDPYEVVDRRVRAGQLWLWDDDGSVSMAGVTEPVAGVARIGPVYTPPGRRGSGYASALVAEMSAGVLAAGNRCILYTDMGNPVSNSVYRGIGYRAVSEAIRYQFTEGH